MEVSSSSSQRNNSDMEPTPHPPIDPASTVWDWDELLDFSVDADLAVDWTAPVSALALEVDSPTESPTDASAAEASDPGKVRKRDPRMSCSNFLAGIVPCACPEMDAKILEIEAEEAAHEKKRLRNGGGAARASARTVRASAGTARASAGTARCQVVSCGADIKELKGYHRRHRVCLRCANATTVLIAGEEKRYCQQCGKFHELPDFDEGKRSCRRKLERHNNRRRRKPVGSKGASEKDSPGDVQSEDASGDGEIGKDSSQIDSQVVQKETCVESEDAQVSPQNRAPDVNSDGTVSLADSGELGGKYNSKHGVSVSYSNKSSYSSLCPTGRISFKLYDWNPAEFPRRLRHQIFQWLSNMPVELEGYIRPGCIILTVFMAMPSFMWVKLTEDPISYVHDFVVAPGGMLSGRGNILVYLNNMVFHVLKSGTSVIEGNVSVDAPRLHYVHPVCFEAGKPMEIVACGSNLSHSNCRFLISFSGKYLAHDHVHESSHLQTGRNTGSNMNHQLYRINVPQTDANNFGPVFIEVENEAGLSNFVPVLIGDKETCLEMLVIQERYDQSLFTDEPCVSSSCEFSSLRQVAFSDILVEIAWLLKKPVAESVHQKLKTFQIQRLQSVLNFLISVDSTIILEKILENLVTVVDKIKSKGDENCISDADTSLLEKYINYAHRRRQELHNSGAGNLHSRSLLLNGDRVSRSGLQNEACSVVFFPTQDNCGVPTYNKSESIPILSRESFSDANPNEDWLNEVSCRVVASSARPVRTRFAPLLRFRPTLCLFAVAAVCLGICSVIFHPHKVTELAVSIRRCLLNKM